MKSFCAFHDRGSCASTQTLKYLKRLLIHRAEMGSGKLQRLADPPLEQLCLHAIIDILRHNPMWDSHTVPRLQWEIAAS